MMIMLSVYGALSKNGPGLIRGHAVGERSSCARSPLLVYQLLLLSKLGGLLAGRAAAEHIEDAFTIGR